MKKLLTTFKAWGKNSELNFEKSECNKHTE
jgi:hypothetical protein